MTSKIEDRAQIVVGSKSEFTIYLVDESGRPIDLTGFVSGKLVFCNLKKEKSEITLTFPPAAPIKGELPVTVPSAESEKADRNWVSADLELVDGSADTTIVVLENKFDIVQRVCP